MKAFSYRYIVLILFCFVGNTIQAQLSANFSVSPSSGCSPLLVDFTDLSTGNPTSWEWTLGNGNNSSIQNPQAVYINPGSYNVTLVVSDGVQYDTLTIPDAVHIHQDPQGAIDADVTSGCADLEVSFQNATIATDAGIQSILWNFGDGNSSTENDPTHTFPPGSYDITLLVVDSNGCSDELILNNYILSEEKPNAQFTSSNNNNCLSPHTVDFLNTSSFNAGAGFFWDFGDGNTSSQQNPSHTYSSYGNYTVSLTVTNPSGCADSIEMVDFVNIQSYTANFASNKTVACIDEVIYFTDLSSITGNFWLWEFGDGNTSNQQNPQHAYSAPGTYTVILTTNLGSCSETEIKIDYITIAPTPTVDFTSSKTDTCSVPFSVDFTPIAPPGVSFYWDFGDSTFSTLSNPTHTYTQEGIYDVMLTVTSPEGCVNSIQYDSLVKIFPPQVIFSADSINGCVPTTVNFNESSISSGNIISWHWDFGDGDTSNLPNPTHTYTDTGSYTVTLSISDDNGCSNTMGIDHFIQVGDHISLDFVAAPLITCVPQDVQFTNLSDSIGNFLWLFGDGGMSSQFSPAYQYGDTGLFSVTLINNYNGCITDTVFEDYITVLPPVANFIVNNQCSNPYMVDLVSTSIGADSSFYVVSTGDTLFSENANYLFPDTGDFSVTLHVFNFSTGCVDSTTQDVFVRNVIADFFVDTTIGCPSFDVHFYDASQHAVQWLWTFHDESTSTSQNTSKTYPDPGFFSVTLAAQDMHGCIDTISRDSLIFGIDLRADMSTNTISGCLPLEVEFIDNAEVDSGTILGWYWDFGDGNSSFDKSPIHTYTQIGTFDITLIVTDDNGCVDTLSIPDYIHVSKPAPSFVVDTLVCFGQEIQFINTSVGEDLSYLWNFGDGNTSIEENPVHSYASTGYYDITLYAIDTNGCDSSITLSQWIHVDTMITYFVADSTYSDCPPLIVNFTNLSYPNIISSQWDFGNGSTSLLNHPSHVYTQVGSFDVTLIVENEAGCIDTLTRDSLINISGPYGEVTLGPLAGCTDHEVDFLLYNTNSVMQTWDFGNGIVLETPDTSVSHTYTDNGIFNPQLFIDDGLGCELILPIDTFIQVETLQSNFSTVSNYVCTNDFLQFYDSSFVSNQITEWYWDFGDGNTSNEMNPSHIYTEGGYFDVTLITYNEFCYDTIVQNNYIYSDNSTAANFSIPSDTLCPSSTISFLDISVSDSSIVDWYWTFGNGDTSSDQNSTSTYTNAGTYSVSLTVTTEEGCVDTYSDSVTIYDFPSFAWDGIDTIMCERDSLLLHLDDNTTYIWNPTSGVTCPNCSETWISPYYDTHYSVYAINESFCEDTFEFDVTVHPTPTDIEAGEDQTVLAGSDVQLEVSSFDSLFYQWTPNDVLSCEYCEFPELVIYESQLFTVEGFNQYGCSIKDYTYIKALESCAHDFFKVANVFTPNNDGRNDVFLPRSEIFSPIIELKIFDRWGKLLFVSNDVNQGWDGTHNDIPVNNGVYIYSLEVPCTDGSTSLRMGNITVAR